MAKINARGARQIGPTLYTERLMLNGKVIEPGSPESTNAAATLYRQAWRLRSDGAVLERIVWTESAEREQYRHYGNANHPGRLTHSSAFSIRGTFPHGPSVTIETLRTYLARRKYTIVKEA